jgi:hypothetical protein
MLARILSLALGTGAAAAFGEGLNVTFDNSDHAAVTHWIFFVIAAVLGLAAAALIVGIERGKRREQPPEPTPTGSVGVSIGPGRFKGNIVKIGEAVNLDRALDISADAEDNEFEVGNIRGREPQPPPKIRSLRQRLSASIRRWRSGGS